MTIMIHKFMENPFLVFSLLLLSLNFSYFFVPKFPKGIPRIIGLGGTFYLLYFFPWCFSFAFLRGILCLFLTWITSFKLLLFCFDKGPLSLSQNPIDFILISLFPLKISRKDHKEKESSSKVERYEMEEIFRQPYLATSFQDFWGRRWNRYASKILRLTIYEPTNETLRFLGKNTSRTLAIVATFVVSAIMHELMFYYITCGLCLKPTCEVMWFFVLQGISISCEKVFHAKNWEIVDSSLSILFKRIFIVFSFYFLLLLPVAREGKNTCDVKI